MRWSGGIALFAMLLAAAPAAATTPRAGDWFGETGPAVDFSVERSSRTFITHLIVEPAAGCRAKQATIVGSAILDGARFTVARRYLGGRVQRTLTGRFVSRTSARGTYRERDTTADHPCDTGTLRWSARRVRRAPVADGTWSGTADGRAVGFRVQQDGRIIDRVSGQAPGCRPGDPPHLFRGPAEASLIRPGGAFSIDLLALPGSVFSGRFTGRHAAAGSAQVRYTADCASGQVAWTARG